MNFQRFLNMLSCLLKKETSIKLNCLKYLLLTCIPEWKTVLLGFDPGPSHCGYDEQQLTQCVQQSTCLSLITCVTDSGIRPARLVGVSAQWAERTWLILGSATFLTCLLQNLVLWDRPHELLVVWAAIYVYKPGIAGFPSVSTLGLKTSGRRGVCQTQVSAQLVIQNM